MNSTQFCRVLALVTCAGWLAACTSHQVIEANPAPLSQPPTPLAENQRLHVGVAVFELDSLAEPQAPVTESVQAAIRKAEGHYIAFTLRQTLQQSGHWGAVRVIPGATDAVDVTVRGRVLESNGVDLKVNVKAWDATGTVHLDKIYERTASRYTYTDASLSEIDPFQDLYHAVANDLAAVRRTLTSNEITTVKRVSTLRFAGGVAPYAFDGYLSESKDGAYTIERLPAAKDPMVARILAIRARERALLQAFDAHYGKLANELETPYRDWRKSSYEETRALRRLERSARQDLVLGSVAAAGGLVGAASSGSALGSAASAASVVGGAAVIGQGVKKYSQAEIHRDARAELASSFSQEIAPQVVELEGRMTTLSGSAEAQFQAWRQLLRELYGAETGLQPGEFPETKDLESSQ